MKKTKYIFSFILLCLIGVNLIYGQAKITATCKYSKVPLNSAFQVTYTITGGTLSSFVKPSFKNFSVTGSYQSSGGGMTLYVNGKLVQGGDGEATYTYTLVPTAIGKYTIDAAKAKVNNEWIESETITIEVTNSGSTATASSNSKTTKNTTTTSNTEAADNDIFLKASIDKTNPYIGEQVIVTYKLYTRIPV
ncbi:MAG TPA: BatD family protein, partial [Bacteroidales bacterium]|nr:BatD family protein [Bacteroidales bacterium]